MPSYQERSQQIKALSEKQYQDARLKKDESESVRIGDRDGTTGRYEILHQDGGITRNGIKTFNQAAPRDGFVRLIGSGNGGIALDHRNRKEVLRRRVTEEPILISPIKFLQTFVSADLTELYVGGDREEPTLIFTAENGYVPRQARLTVLGSGLDEWILQVVSTKQSISGSIYQLYKDDPDIFDQGQLLQTITPFQEIKIYSDGLLLGDGTIYTGQEFNLIPVLYEMRLGIKERVGVVYINDVYSVDSGTGIWTYTLTSRTVTTERFDEVLDPSHADDVLLAIKTELELESSKAISWRTLSEIGVNSLLGGYSMELEGTGTYASSFAANGREEAQLKGLLNQFTLGGGWWFVSNGVYSKTPEKWLASLTSFNTPSENSNIIPWQTTDFTTNTQINSIDISLNAENIDTIALTTASIGFTSSSQNITNIATPTPNGGSYKILDFIQGWNQETQLLKVGDDWRLYDKEGLYTVVEMPSIGALSFSDSSLRNYLSLVGDALFVLSNPQFSNGIFFVAGATLTETPTVITKLKKIQIYPPSSFTTGQNVSSGIYLTIDEYDALEDAEEEI